MNNFIKRAISGFLFVIVLTGCIFLHPICFFLLFFIINIIGLCEFSQMGKKIGVHINLPMLLVCGSCLFTAGFLDTYIDFRKSYLAFFIAAFILSICELYRHQGYGFQNLAFAFYALLYLSLPFTLLIYLPFMSSGGWKPEIIFFPFLLVWFNDTFAYLFGSQFGKHKLFPRISPKKSWEGAIGGGVTTIVAAIIIAPYIDRLTLTDCGVIAGIVVVFGIFGDLLESMFKRNIEVKDSGNIMPGHGGVLDRFDAIIFTIPAIFVYLEFVY